MPKDHNGDKLDRDRGNGLRGRPQGRSAGRSRKALALAAAAALLCLLSAAVPAWITGDARAALISLGLSTFALAAAVSAWALHGKENGHSPRLAGLPAAPARREGDAPGLRLVEGAAVALREPLDTIRGFSELLARCEAGPRGAAELRRSCEFILESSERLSEFVAQLHDFARYEQGRLRLSEQQVDAAELVEAALGDCRGMAEKADVVIVATLLEGVELRCDAARLRRSLASLVLWAAGTAPADGMIHVRLHRLADGGAAVDLASAARRAQACGPERLFEPQLALDGLNGMALPIARRVALLHSGELTIESDPGGGVTARLTLPAHRVVWPGQAKSCESRAA